MVNEKAKQENVKDESSDARLRFGRIRSSDEAAAMAVERRNCVFYNFGNKSTGNGRIFRRRKAVRL
jgi:hypothetical protein